MRKRITYQHNHKITAVLWFGLVWWVIWIRINCVDSHSKCMSFEWQSLKMYVFWVTITQNVCILTEIHSKCMSFEWQSLKMYIFWVTVTQNNDNIGKKNRFYFFENYIFLIYFPNANRIFIDWQWFIWKWKKNLWKFSFHQKALRNTFFFFQLQDPFSWKFHQNNKFNGWYHTYYVKSCIKNKRK